MLSISTSKAKKKSNNIQEVGIDPQREGSFFSRTQISTWCRPGCSVRRDTTNVSSEPTPAISPACPWAGGPTAFTSGRKRVKIFLLNFECTVLNAPLWRRMDRLWCGEECSTDSCQCTKVFSFTTAQPNWR